MIQLLDKAELSPIARIALTTYIEEKPDGMRVSRKSYEDWRSAADDPLLPSYHSLETTQPNVGGLFNELADESSRMNRQNGVFTLCESVKRFHSHTGSKRIRDYNEWRKYRFSEYGENHPAPSLDTRGIRWADVLEVAGLGKIDLKRKPNHDRAIRSMASFIEQNELLTSSAYISWRDRVALSNLNKSEKPVSITSLMRSLGSSWSEVLSSMGIDSELRKRIKQGKVRIEFHLEDGQLVPASSGGYRFDRLRAAGHK